MFNKLKNLFSNKQTEKQVEQEKQHPNLKSVEEFINSDLLKQFIKDYSKKTILLRPTRSQAPLPYTYSKMGGYPNLTKFERYPECTYCSLPLNFVFQLYHRDFPDFYYPEGKNLFQLFRCSNHECSCADYDKYDQPMFHHYHSVDLNQPNNQFSYEIKETDEKMIVDCNLSPLETMDLPMGEEIDNDFDEMLNHLFVEEAQEVHYEEYSSKIGTKLGGYPTWTQGQNYPKCTCGKLKEFLFQFSSEEPSKCPEDAYSAHDIMLGDSGNIYYFYCSSCGEHTIESNWDCY